MSKSRRKFIKQFFSITAYSLSLTTSLLRSSIAMAEWKKEKFQAGSYKETINKLYKNAKFTESKKIHFSRLPKVAENGSLVPITVTSTLKNVAKISILVEKNPRPLIAEFYLSPSMVPHISARFKMAKHSKVIVLIEAEGKFYKKTQYVKVTKDGCG